MAMLSDLRMVMAFPGFLGQYKQFIRAGGHTISRTLRTYCHRRRHTTTGGRCTSQRVNFKKELPILTARGDGERVFNSGREGFLKEELRGWDS